jgi:hypothetical protein
MATGSAGPLPSAGMEHVWYVSPYSDPVVTFLPHDVALRFLAIDMRRWESDRRGHRLTFRAQRVGAPRIDRVEPGKEAVIEGGLLMYETE